MMLGIAVTLIIQKIAIAMFVLQGRQNDRADSWVYIMKANWRQMSREVNVALSTRGLLAEHKEYKSEDLCKSEDFVSNLSSVYVPDVIVSAPWSSAVVEPEPEPELVKHKIRWW